MLIVTFADLRYRYRQFLIAVVGAGVVLALAILLAGLVNGFRAEIHRTVVAVGADSWVMSTKSHGRLTSPAPFPASDIKQVAHEPGVRRASGLLVLPQEVARRGAASMTVTVMGVDPHGLGAPAVTDGRALYDSGQVVIDSSSGASIGDRIRVGSLTFTVVGVVHDRTLNGGLSVMYVAMRDARLIGAGGLPLVTSIVTVGVPHRAPPGTSILSNAMVENNTLQSLDAAIASIKNTRWLMWTVAVIIVAALVYVSALQRVRDFAVLKAIGASSRTLFVSLCLQAVVVTLVAAGVGALSCRFLKGVFNQPVVIPSSAFVTLPLIAIGVGIVSSLVALRAATKADPVAAFGA
jgi:putative ABC transport system permease protein